MPLGEDVSMPELDEPLICARCRWPVARRDLYELFERMHWVCFHYENEHEPFDVDRACRDPRCPSRMIDENPPPDWTADWGGRT